MYPQQRLGGARAALQRVHRLLRHAALRRDRGHLAVQLRHAIPPRRHLLRVALQGDACVGRGPLVRVLCVEQLPPEVRARVLRGFDLRGHIT